MMHTVLSGRLQLDYLEYLDGNDSNTLLLGRLQQLGDALQAASAVPVRHIYLEGSLRSQRDWFHRERSRDRNSHPGIGLIEAGSTQVFSLTFPEVDPGQAYLLVEVRLEHWHHSACRAMLQIHACELLPEQAEILQQLKKDQWEPFAALQGTLALSGAPTATTASASTVAS